MPFKQIFEKNVNENMQPEDGQPGRSTPEAEDADMYLKKQGRPSSQLDIEDQEFRDKKAHPPRFSTLFGNAPPRLQAPPPHEQVQHYYPKPERKSGVFMPMPLFILFAVILFFESTILFAYTVIGLYNNAPSRIFPWAGPGAASAVACDVSQPAINIAPNFVIPGQLDRATVTETVTVGRLPDNALTTSTSTSSSHTSTSSTTSSSSTTSINTAAAVSDIAGILGGLGDITPSPTASIAVVTVVPERSTVVSVTEIFQDPSGNTVPAPSRSTVLSTTTLDTSTSATPKSTSEA